jgi:hypothetical protein
MVVSSGTVGESAYEVLPFFGDLRDFLDAEPPLKNGDESTRLLTGLELREFPLLAERHPESGIDGLLVTCRMVLSRTISSGFISAYSDRALIVLLRFWLSYSDEPIVSHVFEFLASP